MGQSESIQTPTPTPPQQQLLAPYYAPTSIIESRNHNDSLGDIPVTYRPYYTPVTSRQVVIQSNFYNTSTDSTDEYNNRIPYFPPVFQDPPVFQNRQIPYPPMQQTIPPPPQQIISTFISDFIHQSGEVPNDVRDTTVLRNPIIIDKHSIILENDEEQINHKLHLKFRFGTDVALAVKIYFTASEEIDKTTGDLRVNGGNSTEAIYYPSGSHHIFRTEILPTYDIMVLDSRKRNAPLGDAIPIIIELKGVEDTSNHIMSQSNQTVSQFTYVNVYKDLSKPGINELVVEVVGQKVQLGKQICVLQEMFGISDGGQTDDINNSTTNSLCVICLTEKRTTAVLPCRHLCLCQACTTLLKTDCKQCPICRKHVKSFLCLKVSSEQ